jgi:hypothetical protein
MARAAMFWRLEVRPRLGRQCFELWRYVHDSGGNVLAFGGTSMAWAAVFWRLEVRPRPGRQCFVFGGTSTALAAIDRSLEVRLTDGLCSFVIQIESPHLVLCISRPVGGWKPRQWYSTVAIPMSLKGSNCSSPYSFSQYRNGYVPTLQAGDGIMSSALGTLSQALACQAFSLFSLTCQRRQTCQRLVNVRDSTPACPTFDNAKHFYSRPVLLSEMTMCFCKGYILSYFGS